MTMVLITYFMMFVFSALIVMIKRYINRKTANQAQPQASETLVS